MVPFQTRFAPSPTGALHPGHIYAACVAHHFAKTSGGRFTLRIDDIDHTRCNDQSLTSIYHDLKWFDLNWDGDVVFQSQRLNAYQAALKRLQNYDLIYPCFLSRKELAEILRAPHGNLDPSLIRNTDKLLSSSEQKRRAQVGMAGAWRLRMEKAKLIANADKLTWHDHLSGIHNVNLDIFGDIVIARSDIGASYHLAVVIDDSLDQVSLVTRGLDLVPSTHLHRLLQTLLELPTPDYLHHELVYDSDGNRLAKRKSSTSITELRTAGYSANSILLTLPTFPRLG